MAIRAFIAYDMTLVENTTFGNVLEHAQATQPAELDIRYPAAPSDPKEQGTIWRSKVRKEIEEADKFLAFIDLPNANVGFEIGYAFGCQKPVAVYRFREYEHKWLTEPPLRGHFKYRLHSAKEIHDALLMGKFMTLDAAPASGDGVTVLCPERLGEPFLKQIDPLWNWRLPPLTEWDIETLHRQFTGTGLVVWIIVPHGEGDQERDGTENTALSILAGYAKSRPEFELRVFIHTQARPVADVEHDSKRFTSNSELKTLLQSIASAWSKRVADRAMLAVASTDSVASPALIPRRPTSVPLHPDDPFPATADAFIGRESQLGLAGDTVAGLMERFTTREATRGSHGIQLIWVHGFGGMGKSWFLHRIRCAAQDKHPEICSLIVDWDKPDWLAPLASEPRVAEEVFDLLAIRLSQRLGVEAADPYWLAKARVKAAAESHKRAIDRFEDQLQRASAEGPAGVEAHLVQLVRAEGLWHEDESKRRRNIQVVREDRLRYRDLFAAWCREVGETEPAVICPNRELAEGLREALLAAMGARPLVILLDTCDVLSEDLDAWLRELFAPLFQAAAPLLVLIGSRLRPDLHQPKGSRRGWRTSEIPPAILQVHDFGELLRFSVKEIEIALSKLHRPLIADAGRLAETLHRVTLGVPLAVRGLLDLHEDGDPVLEGITALDEDDEPLSASDAVRTVIARVSDRFLLNLENRPEREDDLRDIVLLAIQQVIDHETLRALWSPKVPRERLRSLAQRYSLLSDGDLHPTVRSYLRRHWRREENRPAFFAEVLSSLVSYSSNARPEVAPDDCIRRVALFATDLNLRSWSEGDGLVDEIARALCLARAYGADPMLLEMLLTELPLAGAALTATQRIWHRDVEEERPTDDKIVAWLRRQCSASGTWSEEEKAALALLDGIVFAHRLSEPETALATFANLELAVTHFGLSALPNAAAAGKAYFDCAYALAPVRTRRPDFVAVSVAGYERAIALHYLEAVAYNNVAYLYAQDLGRPEEAKRSFLAALELNSKYAAPHSGLGWLYQRQLGQPEKAEQAFFKAIELDPKYAVPHNGLGWLYRDQPGQPEKAEQAFLKAIQLDPKYADAHIGLGCVYRDQLGQPEKAEQFFLKAVDLDPKSAAAHNGLGCVYRDQLGQPEKAEQAFLKAIALDPKYAAPHNGLGRLFRDQLGQPEKAEQAFFKAIELDRKYAAPHNGLGWLYRDRLGQPEKAEQAFLKAIELDPKYAAPHNGLGWLYQKQLGQPEKAEQAFLKAIEFDPKSAVPHNGLGWLYRDQRQPEKAEQSFLKAIELDPNYAAPHNGLGSLYRDQLGQPEKAEQAFLKAIELDPKYADAHIGLGCVYRDKLGRPEKAEQAFLKAIELDPKSAVPHNGLGWLYRDQLGEPEKSEQAFLKAIELDPKYAAPHNGLGWLYQKQLGRPEKAEQAFLKAIELHAKYAVPHNGLGWLYRDQLGQPEKAEQAFLKAIELDPKYAVPHNGLGWLYRDQLGQPEKSEQAFLKAIELDPKYAAPHNGLGWLYQKQLGQPEKAELWFLKAIELDPKYANPHNGLGWLYRDQLGQPEKSEQAFLKAIELDPKSADAHNGLGTLYEDMGRWSEAIAEFQCELSLKERSGSARRGLAWVALLSRGDVAEANRWKDDAGAQHPATTLLAMAISVWAGEWAATQPCLASWVRDLPKSHDYLPLVSRRRLIALVRKVRDSGGLDELAAIVRSVADRPCWQSWSVALDAVLAGNDASSLTDAQTAEIYRLLTRPA